MGAIQREELLTALERVQAGVDSKDKTEQGSDSLLIAPDFISSYNRDIAVTFPCNTGVRIFVNADSLIKLIKKLKGTGSYVLDTPDSTSLRIIAKNSRHTIPGMLDHKLQNVLNSLAESLTTRTWMDLPPEFCDSLTVCAPAASRKESTFTLSCVYINDKDMLASDNDSVAWCKLSTSLKPMLFKASAAKHIIAINPVQYSGDPSYYHFRNAQGAVISVRRVSGEYPKEFMNFFEFDGSEITITSPEKEVIESLSAASIFMSDSVPAVTVTVKDAYMVVRSQSSRGSSDFKIDIQNSAKSTPVFMIAPSVLAELIKHSSIITVGEGVARISNGSNMSYLTTLVIGAM